MTAPVTPEAADAILRATMPAALPAVRLRRDPLPSVFAKSIGMEHLPDETIPGPDAGDMRCEWWRDADGNLMRVDVGPGARDMVAFSSTGTVVAICRATTDPGARHEGEIARLKGMWAVKLEMLGDPVLVPDITDEPGFELHIDELAAFARDRIAEHHRRAAADREERLTAIAAGIAGLDARALAERFLAIDDRLASLQAQIDAIRRDGGDAACATA